jgi:hypothetical protein
MSSISPSLTILSEEQKFNGGNLLSWTTNMTQLLGAKGLSGYIDGKITSSTQTTTGTSTTHPTPIYSTTPSADEWHFRDQLTRGHITLNCTDIAGLGVNTTGTAKEAWDSIRTEWGTSTNMRQSHAQELLNKTTYVDGASVQDHIKLLRTQKVAVNDLSATAMNDETWCGIIIRSIPPMPRWLPVIPSLYTLTSPADIVFILLAHGMILDRGHENPSNVALTALRVGECTNPNCKARIRSTHRTENCYWPGGGKEGQFPPNFGQRSKANSATLSSRETTQHFALSAWISKQRRTGDTVSEILIEDLDERSHDMSPTMGDNTPLFDTLDNIHTFDNTSNAAAPNTRDPPTPDFTPTSVKTYTRKSMNLTDDRRNVPVEGEEVNLNRRVNREDNQPVPRLDEPERGPDDIDQASTLRVKENPTETDDYPTDSILEGDGGYKTAVTPGTNETNEMLFLAQPEEQSVCKVANGGSGEINWELTTVDDTESIWHLYTNQIPAQFNLDGGELVLKLMDPNVIPLKNQHLSAVARFVKVKDLPLAGTSLRIPDTFTFHAELLEGPPQISSDQPRGGGGVSWINPRKSRERRSPSTTFATQFSDNLHFEQSEDVDKADKADWTATTTTNEEQGQYNPETAKRHEVNPEEGDDAKSNPREADNATSNPLPQWDDAKSNPREADNATSNPLPQWDDAKSNPRKADDVKSNPLPQSDFNGAKTISMPMDQNAILLKGQHHHSLAEITQMENLPYQEGISPLMHAPMGTNPKTPPYNRDDRRIS